MHGSRLSRWGQYLERKHSPRLNHVARGAREGLFARGDEADLPRRNRRGDPRGAVYEEAPHVRFDPQRNVKLVDLRR